MQQEEKMSYTEKELQALFEKWLQKTQEEVIEETAVMSSKVVLSDQSLRLIEHLARTMTKETYIQWKDLYLRQELFEGRKLGDVFAEIGGKNLSHIQRLRKIRYQLDQSLTWRTPEEIKKFKADALDRALKSKAKKRLYSYRKSLNLAEDEPTISPATPGNIL